MRAADRIPSSAMEAEAALLARARQVARDYAMLRLRLSRFAWCAQGVEARARATLRAWGQAFLVQCAEDARRLEVSPDRYVRALFDFLPRWPIPLLVVLGRRDRGFREMVPGLHGARSEFDEHEEMIARFDEVFAPRAVLDPDRVAALVRLRPAALARARARWAGRDLPVAPPAWPVEPVGTGAEAAISPTPLPFRRLAPPEPAGRPTTESRDRQAIAQLFSDIASGRPSSEAIVARIARIARNGGKAMGALEAALRGATTLPAGPVAPLLDALPGRSRRAAVRALRILAAGATGARLELARMSPKAAMAAFAKLSGDTGQPLERLGALALARQDATPARRGNAALLDWMVARASGDGARLAQLLQGLPALRRGRRLRDLASHVAALEPAGFLAFLEAAPALEQGWDRIPVSLREAALASWTPSVEAHPALRARAAALLPSLAIEAARWAGDHRVLGEVIAGPHARAGFEALARIGAEAEATALEVARRATARDGMPAAWLDLARADRRVLRVLARHDLARLASAPLAGLDLATLMAASLRNRRLARRLAEERGDEALAAAMPALRREMAGRTRRIAAAELALLLGWRHAVVLAFLATRPCAPNDAPGTRFDGLYRSWEIPKRRGGKRRITAPVPVLKAIQRRLLDAVLAATPCHPAATGFLPGISIADNARPHVGRKVVVNVDIEGFFPNTRFKLVRRAVERILPRRLSPEARRLVVDICTMGGGLPIGAPTSPAIANHVMLPVDRALAKVAARHGVAYTRYADDLTLSGDDPARLLPFLRQVVGQLGYRLDPKKTNFFRRGRRQVVTGLVVNDKVSVPRKLRRRLRAAVHRVATQGAAAELEWHGRPMHAGELAGRIAFAGVAHPDESRALAARLREGLARKRRGGKAGGGAR